MALHDLAMSVKISDISLRRSGNRVELNAALVGLVGLVGQTLTAIEFC